MQRPPGSGPNRGGRQGRSRGQGRSQGQGRGGGQGQTGYQGRGRGHGENQGRGRGHGENQGRGRGHGENQGQSKFENHSEGQGQGNRKDCTPGAAHSKGQGQVRAAGQIHGGGRVHGGRHKENRGQIHQPPAQIPSLLSPILDPRASFQQNSFRGISQISSHFPGATVGHGHSMATLQALNQARAQVPPATLRQQGPATKHQNQNAVTHTSGVRCLPASNGAVSGVQGPATKHQNQNAVTRTSGAGCPPASNGVVGGHQSPGYAKTQVAEKLKQGQNSRTVGSTTSGAVKRTEDGKQVGVAKSGNRGGGRGGRGRKQNAGRTVGSTTSQSLRTGSTVGTNQPAGVCVRFGQTATLVSRTAVESKVSVGKDGEGVRNRVRGHGSGKGTAPSSTIAVIASTIASGFSSSLGTFMKNLFLKESQIGDHFTAKGRSKYHGVDYAEFSGDASVSSRMMNVRKETDIQNLHIPLRHGISESNPQCVLEEHERDNEEENEGVFEDDVIPRSVGLSHVRQTQRVCRRAYPLHGAPRGVRGGFRRRGAPQPFGQSWAAAKLGTEEVVIEVLDDLDARSHVSNCSESQLTDSEVESWIDVEDADEISFGDADPGQRTTAIHSRGSGTGRSRGCLWNGRAEQCQPYFTTPDVETLFRTKVLSGNSQHALNHTSPDRRTDQGVALAEERKVMDKREQKRDDDQNMGQSDRIKGATCKREQKSTNKGDLANSKSQPAFEVDQNLVIKYLVNQRSGSCTLFDIQNDSGIFPCILQPQEVLQSLGFCNQICVLIDQSDLDNSTVKVYVRKLQLCVAYSSAKGCSLSFCKYVHLCRGFVMDCCISMKCALCHDVESEHNMKIMIKCGIEGFSANQKLSLIRCSNLLVCSEHNSSVGCSVPNSCFKIHICNSYILKMCLLPPDCCIQGHDLFNERNMKILKLHKVDQLKMNFLLRMVVGFQREPFNKDSSLGLTEQQKTLMSRTKPAGNNGSYYGMGQVSGWVATQEKVMDRSIGKDHNGESCKLETHSFTVNSQKSANFSGVAQDKFIAVSSGCEESRRVELSLEDQQKDVCKYFEEHICDLMEYCTKRHGSQTPYLWRVRVQSEWYDLENNELIEEEFSNPAAERFWGSMWDMTVCIDFSSWMSEVGAIQRLSTPSYAVCKDKTDTTRWLWYWLDSTDKWILFGQNDESPYQDVLEAKFLNDSRHMCCFEIRGCNYELDFEKMEQRNLQSNFCRPIRRRPFYRNSGIEIPRIDYHYDASKVPFGWAPMDTKSKHGLELVPLHPDDANYETMKCRFFATLSATNFQIQRIYRVQNLELWESFQMKKVQMEKKTGNQVEEVQAYHGTPEEETIRWICSLGFDQRMHGRHGAKYGTGVYFATTAKYSHCYTQPSDRGLRFMFCAKVLVGRSVEGKGEYRRPPPIDPTKPTEGLYDTCVDSIAKPSIYVVFDNNQSYPEYLIEYREVVAVSDAAAYQSHPASATAASTSNHAFTSELPSYATNQFCGPPASFTTPSPGSYPPYTSPFASNTVSSAGHFPYFSVLPVATYPLQADVSASVAASDLSYHSSASAAPNQRYLYPSDDPPSNAPSYAHENLKSCHIM